VYDYKLLHQSDIINLYLLWRGNDGAYPSGKDGFSQYLEQIGFNKIYHQERTNDYYIYSILWMSSIHSSQTDLCRTGYKLINLFKALMTTIAAPYYIHSYLTYMPYKNANKQPWTWQFIPQYKNGKWISPTSLQYLLFEKS
jgi:hypothetical protein